MNLLLLILASSLASTAPNAQEATGAMLDDAEAIMFSSCLQNKGRTIEQCGCYVNNIKAEMPKIDYHFFMEALYFSSNRDKINFDIVMLKYGKTADNLEEMSKTVAVIGQKIEATCAGDKIILPKPTG